MVDLTFVCNLFNAEKLRSEITSKETLNCNRYIRNHDGENLGTLKIIFQADRHIKRQKIQHKIYTTNKKYLHEEVKLEMFQIAINVQNSVFQLVCNF